MDSVTHEDIRILMERRHDSCISIYMPTHRTLPEAKQNRIRFKNLLKQMERRLLT